MKRKSVRKKSKSPSKKSYVADIRYFAVTFGVVVLVLAVSIVLKHMGNVQVLGAHAILAEENGQGDTVQTNDAEPTDIPEPTERPEPTDKPERVKEVEKLQNEIKNTVENNNVEKIEISAPEEGSGSGKILLQKSGGNTQELSVPLSNNTPVTQITTPQAGTVSVHVSGANAVIIKNGPYTVTSAFPVVINPKDQTMSIRTANGVVLVKTYPLEMFQNMDPQDRLSAVSSLTLTEQQGTPVYTTNGIQVRKLLGIIPVQAAVKQNINAETGKVISSNEPWYFSTFGFAFQSI